MCMERERKRREKGKKMKKERRGKGKEMEMKKEEGKLSDYSPFNNIQYSNISSFSLLVV